MTVNVGDSKAAQVGFRLDNERLAFRFTATRTDRYGQPVERLASPAQLAAWLAANDLPGGTSAPSPADLAAAVALREAIHQIGSQIATAGAPAEDDLQILNQAAAGARAVAQLTDGRLSWACPETNPVRAGLAIIADDAIRVFGTTERDHVKACADPACRGLFIDASQAGRRRWCSMNTCGNRAKKAKFRNK